MEIPLFILSLLAGTILGAVFVGLGLPIPAPPKLAGVTGIIGVYLGYQLVKNHDKIIQVIF